MKHLLTLVAIVLIAGCSQPKAPSSALLPSAEAAEILPAPELPKFKLHKITLAVTRPEDLKVKVGSQVSAGQIIADQEMERARLNQKKNEIMLAINRLNQQIITPPQRPMEPLKPKSVPPLKGLGDISYQQHEAGVEKAKKKAEAATSLLSLKQRQLDYLKGVEGIDPAIIEHELAQVSQLESGVKDASIEIDLNQGKLLAAKQERQEKEYQYSLDVARRIEEANTAQSFYQRQVAENMIAFQRQSSEYEKEVRERDYRITQLSLQLSGIDDSINKLSTIRSPYEGTVKRAKFTTQTDNKLNVELSIVVPVGSDGATAPSSGSSNSAIDNSESTDTTGTD